MNIRRSPWPARLALVAGTLTAFGPGVGPSPSAAPAERRDIAQTGGRAAPLESHVPGEVLLRFEDGASAAQRAAVLGGLGGAAPKALGNQPTALVDLDGLSVAQAIDQFARYPGVAVLEPNYILSAQVTPNDPGFPLQWGLFNNGQTGGTVRADIQAREAWDVFTGSAEVVVAVLDSGIDLTHPDLAPQVFVNPGEVADNGIDDDGNGFVDDVHGWNFVERNNDPFDDRGHGTHVSGIIGAVTDNGVGTAGVAWQVRILPVRFLNVGGHGTTAQAVEAIDYAITMGARIINASWGNLGFSETLRDAIQRAGDAEVVFVTASGNANPALDLDQTNFYPASFRLDNMVSVGASDHNDRIWVFSNYGSETVDLAAPGVNIFSTLPGNDYGYLSGTSMAAPHVCGVLALILGRFPNLTVTDAKSLLLSRTAHPPELADSVIDNRRLSALLPIALTDDVPPAPITSLEVVATGGEWIELEWLAPGDDGQQGIANRYDVRYSTEPLDPTLFETAAVPPAIPLPSPPGTRERLRIDGLQFETTYHVAIRALDELGNAGPLSNPASGLTLPPPEVVLDPELLTDDIEAGAIVDHLIEVHNQGSADYLFDVLLRRPQSGVGVGVGLSAVQDLAVGLVEPHAIGRPALAGGTDDGLRILFLRSGVLDDGIRQQVEAFPEVAVADVVDGTVASPRLPKLLEYDAVILVINQPSGDRIGIGNDLAAYVDVGGGLVATLATFAEGFHLEGRLDDEGYLPLERSSIAGGSASLGAFDDTHPILLGVSNVTGSFLVDTELSDGAELVASWNSGLPFIATKGNVVGMNVLVADQAFWSGDMPLLLVNAAFWASGAVSWLSADPTSGVIPAGETANLTVTFDTTHLIAGNYEADIVLRGNQPERPEHVVRAELAVRGTPRVGLVESLDFGPVFVGGEAEIELVIDNVGTADLAVDAIAVDNADFSVDSTAVILVPKHTLTVPVRFSPTSAGPGDAVLTVFSDDPVTPAAIVELTGEGLVPPAVEVAPSSISAALEVGERRPRTLTIGNPGANELEYELRLVRDEATLTLEENFEDGDLEGWQSAGITDFELTDAVAAAGSRFSYHESFALHGFFNGLYRNLGAIQPGYVGLHVRSGATFLDDAYFVLRDSAGSDVIWFFAKSTGKLYCNADTGGDESFAYDPETWYHVEFREIDFERKRFDYWVDGQLVKAHVSFRSPAEHVDRLDLFGQDSGARSWWDEIFISSHPPVETVRLDRASGRVPPGGVDVLDLELDASGVVGGQYRSTLTIATNVPSTPEVDVPVAVDVTGVPLVIADPAVVDFGPVLVGFEARSAVAIANEGTDDLIVERVEVDHPAFVAEAAGFVLRPGETRQVDVTFRPAAVGVVAGRLRWVAPPGFAGADGARLTGDGRLAPEVQLAPQVIHESLLTGATADRTVTLTNAGGEPLVYEIEATDPAGSPLEAATTVFRDDGEPGVVGWTTEVYGGADLWHRTTLDANSPDTAWWCGLETTGGYDTGERVGTALVSPPLDLRGLTPPIGLRFAERFETEPVYDACLVDVSNDGGRSWTALRGEYGAAPSGSTGGWRQQVLDLSPHAGGIVRVRFYFETADGFNNVGTGWFVDDVHVVGGIEPWLRIGAVDGELNGGESREVPLVLTAPAHPATDRYEGRVTARTNDPFTPEAAVGVTLDVLRPPRLVLPGATVRVDSEAEFDEGQVTYHHLPLAADPAGEGELRVRFVGDLGGPGRVVTVSAEAAVLGVLEGSESACTVSSESFTLSGALLFDLAPDGIDLEVRNPAAVEPSCAANRHELVLVYPKPREALDLGAVTLGESVTTRLTVANIGDGELFVASVDSDVEGVVVTPSMAQVVAGASVELEVRYTARGVGPIAGHLRLSSNDPQRPEVLLTLTGEVRAAAIATVTPMAVTAALPPRSERMRTKTLQLVSSGPVPLQWTAEAPSGVTVAPDMGTVPPGGAVEIAVTFSAAALDAAEYVSTLVLHTNTTDGRIEIPLTLRVGETALARLDVDFAPRFPPGGDVVELALELPEGFDPAEILPATIGLNDCDAVSPAVVALADLDLDGVEERIVQIDLEVFEECLPRADADGIRAVTVFGEVADRTWFRDTRYLRGVVQLP